MGRYSSKLTALLLARGIARLVAPIAIIWGICDWTRVNWIFAAVYGLLTINYVIVYGLSWLVPSQMNGAWRVRPWQTFVVLVNMVLLPVLYYRSLGLVPWGFVGISVLFVAGLYAGTVIVLYLNRRLPMAPLFAQMKGHQFPGI